MVIEILENVCCQRNLMGVSDVILALAIKHYKLHLKVGNKFAPLH